MAEREGFEHAISSKYSVYHHLRSLACVYAGCKHILIFYAVAYCRYSLHSSRVFGRSGRRS